MWYETRTLKRKVIERVQRLAARFIYGKYKRLDPPIHLMQENNMTKLDTRLKIARIKLLPVYTNSLSIKASEYLHLLSGRPTRLNHLFSMPLAFARTNTLKFHFSLALSPIEIPAGECDVTT